MAYTTINKGSSYFNTVIYSGNGTNPTSITSVGFKPDWLWIKCRSDAFSHCLFDAVRGPSKRLISNSTAAESTETQIASFDTSGWTMDADTANNGSGKTYVAWNWLGANTTVSNTSGTITSTVSANTTAGFSVVSYTGAQGSNFTIGHGLSVTPNIVFAKSRNTVDYWGVYYRNNGVNTNYMTLNSTDAQGTNNGSLAGGAYMVMNSTTLQIDFAAFANAGSSMIAYCFAEVKGYSKFSSFVGNGSTNGAFVYTGFKPAFVIIKASSTGGTGYNWGMWDNKRIGYNPDNNDLRANLANAESTDDSIDLVSNGFKIRTDSGGFGGGSGVTYIYMAFAENPFVTSGGIPVTAR